jgi:hypothetical protein
MPGVLLVQIDSDGGSVVQEIDKVGQTMPLNMFFGGQRRGQKLHRVLIAFTYSQCV